MESRIPGFHDRLGTRARQRRDAGGLPYKPLGCLNSRVDATFCPYVCLWEGDGVRTIDQTRLTAEESVLLLSTVEDLAEAISRAACSLPPVLPP